MALRTVFDDRRLAAAERGLLGDAHERGRLLRRHRHRQRRVEAVDAQARRGQARVVAAGRERGRRCPSSSSRP
jgi:hypothetical protein